MTDEGGQYLLELKEEALAGGVAVGEHADGERLTLNVEG